MRILLVIHGYPPYYMAGSEVYTYNLARELAKTNDVFVFHRIEDKDIPLHQFFDSFEEGVHIRKINNYEPTPATFYDKYLNPEIDDAFREYVKKVNPDVVHIGHLSHLSTQIPIIAKREFGLPVFFTIHDFWMFCHRGQLINPQNWEILERLGELSMIGRPLLIGAADKRFTGGDNRRAHMLAARGGAAVLRVHDVAATRRSLEEEGFPIDSRSGSCPEG